MSTPTERWKHWEGRVVDAKFPLRQWLGSSDHSAVFRTERIGKGSQKAAIKLIPAGTQDEAAQLSRWAGAARLSRPHLLQIFECGRYQLDGTRLLYVVMEYSEENLSEILPLRPLSPAEASEMLPPAIEALASLHRAGFTHSRIQPSNIMAVDNRLKISTDGLRKIGEPLDGRSLSPYDAPEVAIVGTSPAADIWSLGITLLAVLTQNEPKLKTGPQGPVAVPNTIPQPLREILQRCLQSDPKQRGTLDDILKRLQPQTPPPQPLQAQALQANAPLVAKLVGAHLRQQRLKRWIVLPIVVAALFLVAWLGSKLIGHPQPIPAAENRAANPPAEVPATQSPAPFSEPLSEKEKPAKKGITAGSVLQQVQPDVSRGAQNTIEGRVKVSVQVEVDASGSVSAAKLVSPGPSKYFAERALAAARRWKFDPPQVDGQAVASEWVLRFQFKRTATQIFPAQTKP
jgi:TonB family protein